MREFAKVYSTFWSSTNIRSLSEDGRMLALYLMTCPHATISGVFRIPDGYACEDLQWSSERASEGFRELFRNGFANRCETTKWVWILKHFEWNKPENPNQRKAAAKIAESIPDECSWKPEFMRVCSGLLGLKNPCHSNPCETVTEPFRNQYTGESTQESKPTSSLRSEGERVAAESDTSEPRLFEDQPPPPDAEPSLQAAIFETGLPVMVAGGCTEKSARSLLGKLRKEAGDLDALVVVEAMARETPAEPAAWLSAAIKSRSAKGQTFDAWRTDCKARGESLISDYQPVLSYCQGIGLPSEWLNLAWAEFRRQHGAGGLYADRKSEDWRAKFRAAIERNFLRLWFRDAASGTWMLTTAGQQAEAAHEADRATRKAATMQEAA